MYDEMDELTEEKAKEIARHMINAVLRSCPGADITGVEVVITFRESEPWEISFTREELEH